MLRLKSNFTLKILLILATLVFSFVFFFSKPIITQPQDYHLFADQRTFFGIHNFMDVMSNIFFLVAGFLGLRELIVSLTDLKTKLSWKWFFISIVLIAPGSAYYHLDPTDATLVWDRLPMSIGFMALYVSLLSEHINIKAEKFLPLALLVGLLSVITWAVSGDLRFYFWVQFSSFLTIPVILLLFSSLYTKKQWYFIALVIYALAKWTEAKDIAIFHLTGGVISGHTLKHILAALGLMCLWWMLKIRSEVPYLATSCGDVADPTGQA